MKTHHRLPLRVGGFPLGDSLFECGFRLRGIVFAQAHSLAVMGCASLTLVEFVNWFSYHQAVDSEFQT